MNSLTVAPFSPPLAAKNSPGSGLFGVFDKLVARHKAAMLKLDMMSQVAREFNEQVSCGPASSPAPTVELPAAAKVHSFFWLELLNAFDVWDYMPAQKKREWMAAISNESTLPCPEFSEDAARSTLLDWWGQRALLLSERVSNIFYSLSGSHVTNRTEGFSKRMIIERFSAGDLHDLRSVIALLRGLTLKGFSASSEVIVSIAKSRGDWIDVDGGALRVRVFKKGTGHLEVHEDVAWELNQLLHKANPGLLASGLRKRSQAKRSPAAGSVKVMETPLPSSVLAVIRDVYRSQPAGVVKYSEEGGSARVLSRDPILLSHRFNELDAERVFGRAAVVSAKEVISEMGGRYVPQSRDGQTIVEGHFAFDFCAAPIFQSVITNGTVPEQKTHQQYFTPSFLAELASAALDYQPGETWLEPSAGDGALCRDLPPASGLCVELSTLYAKKLECRGFSVFQGDFLSFSESSDRRFDRIIMNPPYSEGRWIRHVEAARALLSANGRLVAILPATAVGKLEGASYSDPIKADFSGAKVTVVIATIQN